jgi:hypothetical protein
VARGPASAAASAVAAGSPQITRQGLVPRLWAASASRTAARSRATATPLPASQSAQAPGSVTAIGEMPLARRISIRKRATGEPPTTTTGSRGAAPVRAYSV